MSFIAKAAIAAVSLGLAAPALAEDPKPAEARPAAATSYRPSDTTRICVRETITGSRVPRMICNTMKGWKAQGVDPFQR
ncbi:hypothetical protein [Sphingomonas spermidinifaciens]|nr:hypothetical protein [Sphingomonas spermidinifaciens]